MKNQTIILLIVLNISCCDNKNESYMLYEEYIDAYYHAYKKTFIDVSIKEPKFNIGDTIKFCEKSWLAPINKHEFKIEETIKVSKNSKWIISEVEGTNLRLISLVEPKIEGVALKDIIDFNLCYWDLSHEKWMFYEALRKNLKIYFDSIAIRNKISHEELMQKLAEEKYIRTGIPYFAFEY